MIPTKHVKLAKKYAQQIADNDAMVIFTVKAVMEDLRNGVHPPHEMVIPALGQQGTVGSIIAIQNLGLQR